MPNKKPEWPNLSRRNFLVEMGLASAAAVLIQSSELITRGWLKAAEASSLDAVRDTFNALLAFVLPGSDAYSTAQGVSTARPGGVEAAVTDILIDTVDQSASYLPGFSSVVSTAFNDLAALVNPTATGEFDSHFAHLSFSEKVAVFQIMDTTDALKPLIGVLPAITAYLAYSEAGVFDPGTRSITGVPVGWALTNYEGVADGRDEFRGYLEGRRRVRS